MSVAENLALRTFDKPPQAKWNLWLMLKAIRESALGLIQIFSIKTPTPETPIQQLSRRQRAAHRAGSRTVLRRHPPAHRR